MKLITAATAPLLIAAYQHSACTGKSGQAVLAKFFTPWAGCTWWITEGMPVDEAGQPVAVEYLDWLASDADRYNWHLFGFADIGAPECAELGYTMLAELQAVRGPGGLRIERDTNYGCHNIDDILIEYGRIAA